MNENIEVGLSSSPAVVETRGLRKIFTTDSEATAALDGVDFAVRRNEFVAIMGPSGSGKSTLLYLIAGLALPTSGEIFIEGAPISSLRDAERAQLRNAKMGFVFQRFNLLGFLSVRDNVELPRLVGWKPAAGERTVDELLAAVGLAEKTRQRASDLSAGEQQRVAIARSLVNGPDILLADEPTGNLDTRNAEAVLDLLLRLRVEWRLTILLVTHNPEVAARADRTVEMRDGKVLREWTPQEVRSGAGWSPRSPAAFRDWN